MENLAGAWEKTAEAIRLVEQCTGPAVFLDSVGTHAHLLRGFVPFSQPGPLVEYLRINRGRRVRVVYVPKDEFPEQHVIAVCLASRAFGNLILCLDEIDQFCGPEWGQKGMPKELYNLAHFGRHYRVSMLCTARDPATLSIKFRSQCAYMRIFRTSEERYANYFAARIGKVNATKLPTSRKPIFCSGKRGTSTHGSAVDLGTFPQQW